MYKLILRHTYIIILSLLASFNINAQPQLENIRHLSSEGGLSSNTVMSIIQDRRGFIWIGTKNGLNRYDGHTIEVFLRGKTTNSLTNSMILCMTEDRYGLLWIGTDKGVCRYNPYTGRFAPFNTKLRNGLLSDTEVRGIAVDRKNNIWIMARNGLLYYDRKHNYVIDVLKQIYHKKRYNPSGIYICKDNTVYVGLENNGLIMINKNRTAGELVIKNHISPTTLAETDGNKLLIGTAYNGLYCIDRKSIRLEKININYNGTTNIYCRDIKRIRKNEYWVGTEKGIFILQNGIIHHIFHEDFNGHSISDNAVYSICKDKYGGIWIGSYFGGVDYLPQKSFTFNNYYPSVYHNSISGYRIRQIIEDSSNNLWIATEDKGLDFFNTHTGRFNNYDEMTQPAISFSNIQCLNLNNDELWIGTYTRGIDVMNLKNHSLRHYDSENNSGIHNDIFAIYTDNNKRVWIGTPIGAYIYNKEKNKFNYINWLSGYFVSDIIQDFYDYLWFASYNYGLLRYNPKTHKIKRYRYDKHKINSLCYDRITALYQDSHHNLWIASEDGGFCRYNRKEDNFKCFSMSNGLPSNVVYCILEDKRHTIWLSTNRGIVNFDPIKERIIRTYDSDDGLPIQQFNYNSGVSTQSGKIYFGSINGLTKFDPSQKKESRHKYEISLTNLYVNNEKVIYGNNKNIIDKAFPYANEIKLKYNQSTFGIDFSAMNYSNKNEGLYAYKLDKINSGWSYLEKPQRITYNNIPPGEYLFHIKYSADDYTWDNPETTITIIISPPIWKSKIAYLLYIIIILLSTWTALYKYLNYKKKEEREKQKDELHKAQMNFITNLSHEIRTPVTLIKEPLDYIIRSKPSEKEIRDNLNIIDRNTNRLLYLINQLLDYRKINANQFDFNTCIIDLCTIVNDIFEMFLPTAKIRNINMTLKTSQQSIYINADKEALTKVFFNLIDNALKYADSYIKIGIELDKKNHCVKTIVRNNGKKIPTSLGNKIFEAFYQLPDRTRMQGSGIGLALTKELVNMHQGKIYLDNNAEDISFVVVLPVDIENVNHNMSIVHVTKPHENDNENSEKERTDKNESVEKRTKVLVVEDDQDLNHFLTLRLSKSFDVKTTGNGKQALNLLQNEPIDIIITDIMMPIMDGVELCTNVKNNVELCHISVIMLTAKTTYESKLSGIQCGADAYIEKPFSWEFLLAQIDNLIANRQRIKQYFTNNPLSAISSLAKNDLDEKFLTKLTSYINANMQDESFNIDSIAENMNMSRSSLHRKIKSLTETTPNDFVRLLRLKHAAVLISEGKFSIGEICIMVGFQSQSYFTTAFSHQFNMTPTEFAKKATK